MFQVVYCDCKKHRRYRKGKKVHVERQWSKADDKKQKAGPGFDKRILERYASAARTGPAAKLYPRKYRDEIVTGNSSPTRHARAPSGQRPCPPPQNQHVEKTSDNEAEYSEDSRGEHL